MGYDLREGSYNKRVLPDEEMLKTINWLFSTCSINENKDIIENLNYYK